MARAAEKWLYNNDPSVRRVDVCTAWSHGRKTFGLAHRRILGDSFNIGILTFPKETLPMQKWWTTRSGFRGQVCTLPIIRMLYCGLFSSTRLELKVRRVGFDGLRNWVRGTPSRTIDATCCRWSNRLASVNWKVNLNKRPLLYILFSASLFGASPPLAKMLVRELPPVALAGFLYLGAFLGLTVYSVGEMILLNGSKTKRALLERKTTHGYLALPFRAGLSHR